MSFLLEKNGWLNIHKSINVAHYVNKFKDRRHTNILIDTVEHQKKVHHAFMIKVLGLLRGMLLLFLTSVP